MSDTIFILKVLLKKFCRHFFEEKNYIFVNEGFCQIGPKCNVKCP